MARVEVVDPTSTFLQWDNSWRSKHSDPAAGIHPVAPSPIDGEDTDSFPFARWAFNFEDDDDCNRKNDGEGSASSLNGMTPTPNSKETYAAFGSLDTLDDDIFPHFDIDLEDDDADFIPRSIPTFATPADAAEYLRSGRPDIDNDVQRCIRRYEKSEGQQAYIAQQQKLASMDSEHRRIAIQSLIQEAANRSLRSIHPELNNGVDGPTRRELIDAWRQIEFSAVSECVMEGYQGPQRNLSCMCMFAPSTREGAATPLPARYGENDVERIRRATVQSQTLRALSTQNAVSERSPSLFLKSPATALSSPSQEYTIHASEL